MKMKASKAKELVGNHCISTGMKVFNTGYVKTNEENLIEQFGNWGAIQAEFSKGQGSELVPDKTTKKAKFCALYSSSALCVNNFARFKNTSHQFPLFGFTNICNAEFEKKMPTGISKPNLDFYFETATEIVGVESKFLEPLSSKLPNQIIKVKKKKGEAEDSAQPKLEIGNLEKYLNRKPLKYLPDGFQSLIEDYISYKEEMYVDVAQLLKHTIGLLNPKNNPQKLKPVLVYIYWLPTNWNDIDEYIQHDSELKNFETRIKVFNPFITFKSYSYLQFWKECDFDRNLSGFFSDLKRRYQHAL